jgi:hypothetical protein
MEPYWAIDIQEYTAIPLSNLWGLSLQKFRDSPYRVVGKTLINYSG